MFHSITNLYVKAISLKYLVLVFFYLFKEGEAGHTLNRHKAKPSSKRANNPKLYVWDLVTVFWILSRDLRAPLWPHPQ